MTLFIVNIQTDDAVMLSNGDYTHTDNAYYDEEMEEYNLREEVEA